MEMSPHETERPGRSAIRREILVSVVTAHASLLLLLIPWVALNVADPMHDGLPGWAHKTALYLHLLNYSLDPYVYAFRATDYKLGFFLLCNRRLQNVSPPSDDMYNIDFNEIGEEYNNNLSELVREMQVADTEGFGGIVRKQNMQRAKLRFQSSIQQIVREHREEQQLRLQISRMRSHSTKTAGGRARGGGGGVEVSANWQHAVTLVRVRDVINLHVDAPGAADTARDDHEAATVTSATAPTAAGPPTSPGRALGRSKTGRDARHVGRKLGDAGDVCRQLPKTV